MIKVEEALEIILDRIEVLGKERVNMPGSLNRVLAEDVQCRLSGGEKQRVALARALAITPGLLLMDEPFSALDISTKQRLWIETKALQKQAKVTTVHITHNLEEAFVLSDRIGFLEEGRLIQTGSREEIFYSPKTPRSASYLGISNIFEGEVLELAKDSLKVRSNGFMLDIPFKEGLGVGQKVKFCIRSEEIKVLEERKPVRETLLDNVFKGRIVAAMPNSTAHTLYFKAASTNGRKGFDFEIKLPTHRYQKLGLSCQKEIAESHAQEGDYCFFIKVSGLMGAPRELRGKLKREMDYLCELCVLCG